MRDFETLNAVDLQYGLSARYTLPTVKTTLAAHGTMYMRRGYGSAQLNTDDFVLNASLSQPFMKGKLIFRVEAFDLLHQLSSTQYEVNAQGRTETWYRSLPHYVMGHLVYHFNRNPKNNQLEHLLTTISDSYPKGQYGRTCSEVLPLSLSFKNLCRRIS